MKKIIMSILAGGIISLAATTESTNWSVDNSHSSILFAVQHMTVAKTMGWFTEYDVKMTSNGIEDYSNAQVEITIQGKSVITGNEQRDNHLKGKDFFHTDSFPTITFKSTSFTKVKGNNYKIKGNLTMRGVTKEETFDAVYNGMKKDPWGNNKAGWAIRGKVDRTKYGVNWNAPLEGGGNMLEKNVEIMCEFELVKK
ncbi:MAG: YceI family protein [Bacteroidia bacterium]